MARREEGGSGKGATVDMCVCVCVMKEEKKRALLTPPFSLVSFFPLFFLLLFNICSFWFHFWIVLDLFFRLFFFFSMEK